jgi:hypothetical protein
VRDQRRCVAGTVTDLADARPEQPPGSATGSPEVPARA